MPLSINIKNKVKGCIYGQAIGDALGLGSEFMTTTEVKKYYPDGLSRYEQIIQDNHRCRWAQGEWTDDTDMMLCIARSRTNNHFNIEETACNFKKWFNDYPVGIGRHTYNVLAIGDYIKQPFKVSEMFWNLSQKQSAANGALMRTSILGTSPLVDETEIADICRLTHYDPRCVGSCILITRLIQHLIFEGKAMSIGEMKHIGQKYDERINNYLKLAQTSDSTLLQVDDEAMGYTLKTMAVALWTLWHSSDFTEGLLSVVNLGGDADTNAAVACAVLGAKYGFKAIPPYYITHLKNKGVLEDIYQQTIEDLKPLFTEL